MKKGTVLSNWITCNLDLIGFQLKYLTYQNSCDDPNLVTMMPWMVFSAWLCHCITKFANVFGTDIVPVLFSDYWHILLTSHLSCIAIYRHLISLFLVFFLNLGQISTSLSFLYNFLSFLCQVWTLNDFWDIPFRSKAKSI